jgi:hypothetical protein
MDIIHELSLIINIIEEQQNFTFAQAKRLNFSFGTLPVIGSFREQVVSSMNRFKALRDRAGIAKSSVRRSMRPRRGYQSFFPPVSLHLSS